MYAISLRTRSGAGSLLLALLVLLFLPYRQAAAQQSGTQPAEAPVRVIGLEEALNLALARNLSLQQSANDVALSGTALNQQRAAFLPDLRLSATPSVRFGRGFDQTTGTLSDQRNEGLNLNASSSLNLFNGFGDVASLKEARLSLKATENNLERSREEVLYQTTAQYLQVFLAEALIRVEEENLAAQQQQLASIEAAYEAGNRPIADVLQQRAAIAQSEQRLIAARRDHNLAQLQLKQTLNLAPLEPVTFAAPPDTLLAAAPVDYDVATLVQQALSSRPDIVAQRLQIEAAEQSIRAARAGYYPSISLNASTGTSYSSLNERFSLGDQLSNVNPNSSLGLSISIPVFDRLQTKASVERAQVSAANQRLALERLEQQVAFDVQQALLDYETAQAQLRTAERQLESARQSLQAAEARYSVGASTLLEVTEARRLFVEAATGRLQALYNVLESSLAVSYGAGQIEAALARLL